jgi:hypothetical protein
VVGDALDALDDLTDLTPRVADEVDAVPVSYQPSVPSQSQPGRGRSLGTSSGVVHL